LLLLLPPLQFLLLLLLLCCLRCGGSSCCDISCRCALSEQNVRPAVCLDCSFSAISNELRMTTTRS
jgi:hypothetical protein